MNKLFSAIIISAIIGATASLAPVAGQKKSKQKKTREITIYVYQRPAETNGEFYGQIVSVRRTVADDKPLGAAMKSLLEGATEAEQKDGLASFIFGLKFVSVRVKNKTAQVNFKFEDEKTAEESWEGGGFDHTNFVKAVEQTARQFPGVERVEICVNGVKNYIEFNRANQIKCSF